MKLPPHLAQGLTPAFCEFLGIEKGFQCNESCLHRIDAILGTEGLAQNVLDTTGIHDVTNRTTSNNTSTWNSRSEQYTRTLEFTKHLVRDGVLGQGNSNHVFLGLVDCLPNCFGDIIGLTGTISDLTVLITHYHESGEREPSSTFYYFGNPVESYQLLYKLAVSVSI